jgi:pleckstrin family protein A (phosphoinositide binding specific) protein 8
MEGDLFKWTNYWNGWQLRYFVLKDGVLTYYNNKEESKNGGCKRSFKISMFDIIGKKNKNKTSVSFPKKKF